MTRPLRLGIIGYPLSHSLSPIMHPIFMEDAGLTGSYDAFELPPSGLRSWLEVCGEHGVQGFNVTIPYKVSVLPAMSQVSESVEWLKAVNTVCVRPDKKLEGFNTDSDGFARGLREGLTGQPVLILGSGGSSRAVAYALLQHRPSTLRFQVRDLDRAKGTFNTVREMAAALTDGATTVEARCTWDELNEVRLVVNTTPVGMSPNTEAMPLNRAQLESLPQEALVYDIIYNPLETRLLQEARALGLATRNGLDMLIYQGARAFEIWTGRYPEESSINRVRAALTAQI